MKIKEFLVLVLINLKVKWFNFIEFVRVIYKYYPHYQFCKIDFSLLSTYLFENPFKISKRFLVQRGESDVYTFGETPLTTLEQIARSCGLTTSDVVIELGCGRGRTCFWLNQFIGCRVIGIDYVPEFIQRAEKVKERFHVEGVEFHQEDLFQSDLTGATAIYLYGTCYSSSQIECLIETFSSLPIGTKVITVSYALNDFRQNAPCEIIKQFPARFTWGTAIVTLQILL